MLITKTSVLSGITRTLDIPVTEEEVAAWHSGLLIQVAMPNLTAEQREFIMTGVVSEEWDTAFDNSEDSAS